MNLTNLLHILSKPDVDWLPVDSEKVDEMEELADHIEDCEDHDSGIREKCAGILCREI